MKTEEEIIEVIAQQLGVEPSEVTPEKTFAQLGADSLDLTELIMTLEQLSKREISEKEAEQMKTVSDVLAFIRKGH